MSIDRVAELEREIARLHALQADALVAVASADRVTDEYLVLDRLSDDERLIHIEDAVREEVAAALRWSPSTAQRRIDTARLLAGPLSATKAALAVGDIAPGHVNVITEAVGRLPGRHGHDEAEREVFAAACAELERRVLPMAKRGTLSMTRIAARRAVAAIDAEGEQRRRRAALCTREVNLWDDLDGMSTFVARMTTEKAHAVMTVVDALAHDRDFVTDCASTMGERRVEAFTQLVLGGAEQRVEARLEVVIDLPTLLSLHADADAGNSETSAGIEIGGAGPIGVDALRDLLADPAIAITMRRLVTDPVTGHLLDVGRRTYEVPRGLRDFIVARDQTCRFPGCGRRASRCQIDHAEAWEDGGDTSVANLGALCVRHHQLKTHGGWQIIDSEPDGSCIWESPRKRRYQHRARTALPPPRVTVIDVLPDPPPF